MKRRRDFGGWVAFSLGEREAARLAHIARRLGYSTLDTIAADMMRIGLDETEQAYVPSDGLHFGDVLLDMASGQAGRRRVRFRATSARV